MYFEKFLARRKQNTLRVCQRLYNLIQKGIPFYLSNTDSKKIVWEKVRLPPPHPPTISFRKAQRHIILFSAFCKGTVTTYWINESRTRMEQKQSIINKNKSYFLIPRDAGETILSSSGCYLLTWISLHTLATQHISWVTFTIWKYLIISTDMPSKDVTMSMSQFICILGSHQ